MRDQIKTTISAIVPFDEEEKRQIAFAKNWIKSGAGIWRITKPAMPDPHLVVYFLLIDPSTKKILLVDHKKAGSWLPSGGHVEENELPIDAVHREIAEELNCKAEFFLEMPFFLTVRETLGALPLHTDISLWFALKGSSLKNYVFDEDEFNEIRWFKEEDIPYAKTDPNLPRAIAKLKQLEIL